MSTATADIPAKVPDSAPSQAPSRPAWRVKLLLLLVAAYWIARLIAMTALSGFAQFLTLFWSPIALTLGCLLWLVGFSRMTWTERGWIVSCLVATGVVIRFVAHPSMGMGLILYALPVAITLTALAIFLTRQFSSRAKFLVPLLAAFLGWGYYALLRFDGVDGGMVATTSWRWSERPEDKFLRELGTASTPSATPLNDSSPLVADSEDWPEFRGVQRDGKRDGVRIANDWKANPPEEAWRRRVGPSWSSFSVVGDRVFTQDQRGEKEAVICLSLESGGDLWVHEDTARFEEVVAGAGPRATPTFREGRLYTLGGSGRLNCLDAATGTPVWSRDMAADAHAKPPMWGFSSSPLVAGGLVYVFAGGPDDKAVLAYEADTGELKWSSGKGTHSYSSPHWWLAENGPQVLAVSDIGLEAFEPETGELLWSHDWSLKGMARVVQPAVLASGSLLLGTGFGNGTRVLTPRPDENGWTVEEGWTSKELKPYFNDFVLHEGYAYGFDGEIFCCINTDTGERQWKKGRYGHGQVLLLSDSGLLIVLSEKGELVLLEANPKKLVERGKYQALPGKTWNHPVVIRDRLLVRNGEEAACYRLTLEDKSPIQSE